MSKYDDKKWLEAVSSESNHGEIIANGGQYDPWYGASFIYITSDDIERIKAGDMFYYSDGEYAYCLVYKGEELAKKVLKNWPEIERRLVEMHEEDKEDAKYRKKIVK